MVPFEQPDAVVSVIREVWEAVKGKVSFETSIPD